MSEVLNTGQKFEHLPAGEVRRGDQIRFAARGSEVWAEVKAILPKGKKSVEFVLRSATEGVSLGAFGEHRIVCRKTTILGVRRG